MRGKKNWDLIKMKNFVLQETMTKKVTRQPMEWEAVFANRVSGEGPVSRICKEFSQLNDKNINKPIKK